MWPVVPMRPNRFQFDIRIPSACELTTTLAGVAFSQDGFNSPGTYTVVLDVDALPDNSFLFGDIEIRTLKLKRLIHVSGGSFGVPKDSKPPDINHPVFVGEEKRVKPAASPPPKPKEPEKKAGEKNRLLPPLPLPPANGYGWWRHWWWCWWARAGFYFGFMQKKSPDTSDQIVREEPKPKPPPGPVTPHPSPKNIAPALKEARGQNKPEPIGGRQG